ncbi:WD40 repeat-like protein [Mycena galericulata]|nr:WD40 repeat-like protein [Mycena galericulata]KAJ7454531.1 WD40 repeat-like protein [Mycena galericulata]
MSGMLFANFNQDYSCVSVGTRKGYSITNCDPFGRVYTQNDGARGIVEMLFATSLLALVGAPDTPSSSPRKLQIVNTKRQSLICELLFPASILAVKLNRKTLAIVLETEIYVYDISNMRLLHVIETVPNPEGICALSPSADAPYLAYPAPLPSPALAAPASSAASTAGSTSTATSSSLNAASATGAPGSGDVMLFSTRALAPANVVRAHHSPLALLSLSADGGLLATASVKGTVIRVFAVPSLDKLYQFRRGTREAHIYSLAFNGAGTLLAAASERGTVHLWRVGGGAPGSSSPSPSNNNNGNNTGVGARGANGSSGPESPAESTDGHTLDAGYDAFVAGKRRGSGEGRGTMSAALRRSTGALAKYLPVPAALTEMWEPARDFAWARVPPVVASASGTANERRCVVGLSSTTPHLFVIASDGYFYAYNIDLERGGECVLVKQYSLLESGEETGM